MAEFAAGDNINVRDNDELAMTGTGIVVEVWNSLEDVPEEFYDMYADAPDGNDYPTIIYVIEDDVEATHWYGGASYISKIGEGN